MKSLMLVVAILVAVVVIAVGCSEPPPPPAPKPTTVTVTVHDTVKVKIMDFVRHFSTAKTELSHGIDTLSFKTLTDRYPKEYIGKIVLSGEDDFRGWVFKKTTVFNSVVIKERLTLGNLSSLSGQELGFTIKGEPKKVAQLRTEGEGAGETIDTLDFKVANEVDLFYNVIDFGD